MNITPVIPDGYNGPIKQLTCRVCKHIFYLTMADYRQLGEVSYCYECSLVLMEEFEKTQGISERKLSKQESAPSSFPPPPLITRLESTLAPSYPSVRVPQPRTLEREKMTIEQLLEEAKMLEKTWRYKEALISYEQALHLDPECLVALYGKADMLRQLDRAKDALTVYEKVLQLDGLSVKVYMEKGWTLLSLRNYEDALTVFDQALQLDPSARQPETGKDFILTHVFHHREKKQRSIDAPKKVIDHSKFMNQPCETAQDYYQRGYELLALDRDDEAFQAFARSLELDPLDLDVYDHVATLHFVRRNHEKSLALYNQALHFFPQCAILSVKRVEAFIRLKKYQEALDACEQAIQLDERSVNAYTVKGKVLHQLRRLKEALDTYDLAISLDHDADSAYKQKAEVLIDLHRYDEALITYDQALALEPYDVYLYRDKAKLLAQMGREEDALVVFDQCIEHIPESFEGYQQKLYFLSEHKRYADGLATCEQCKALHPQWAEAYGWQGRVLRYLKRYDEALIAYTEALQFDPEDEYLYLAQASTLVQLKRLEEALLACEQALQHAPTSSSPYREKGDILTSQKRYEEALSAYQMVVQLDPKDASAFDQVGDTLCELKRYADALKAYDRALHLRPDGIRTRRSKADALKKLGQYQQALTVYNKALEQSPDDFWLLVGRADVLKKLLRYEEANTEYMRAELKAPQPFFAIVCIFGKVDLKKVEEAKARLQAVGNALSDEAIEAEMKTIFEEKRLAEEKAKQRSSPLFEPLCLLMQERQHWSGTAKQFKELLCSQFPEALANWYRAPAKFVAELKKIIPELQQEGIVAGIPPETTLVTLTREAGAS